MTHAHRRSSQSGRQLPVWSIAASTLLLLSGAWQFHYLGFKVFGCHTESGSLSLKHSHQNYCQLAFGSLLVCSDTGVQPVKKEAHLSHSGAQKHQKAALTSSEEIYSLCSCCIARKMRSSAHWQLEHGYFKMNMLVCNYSKPRQPLQLLECGSSGLFSCI